MAIEIYNLSMIIMSFIYIMFDHLYIENAAKYLVGSFTPWIPNSYCWNEWLHWKHWSPSLEAGCHQLPINFSGIFQYEDWFDMLALPVWLITQTAYKEKVGGGLGSLNQHCLVFRGGNWWLLATVRVSPLCQESWQRLTCHFWESAIIRLEIMQYPTCNQHRV